MIGVFLAIATTTMRPSRKPLWAMTWRSTHVRFALMLTPLIGAFVYASYALLRNSELKLTCFDNIEFANILILLFFALCVPGVAIPASIWLRMETHVAAYKRIRDVEGDLEMRLRDESVRLLRVSWLLDQAPKRRSENWILSRRQELPDEAFMSGDEAVVRLKQLKVAALSYRWLSPSHPDPDGWHLDCLLAYFSHRRHSTRGMALMWDYASLPQRGVHGEERTGAETAIFKHGLAVMSSIYGSPRTLMLQQRHLPADKEAELESLGGVAPPNRPDLIPYRGERCRSGWCTFEDSIAQLAMLTMSGRKNVHLLSSTIIDGQCIALPAKKPHSAPELKAMETLFHDESTRFVGSADRSTVTHMYLDMHARIRRFDIASTPAAIHFCDGLLASQDPLWRMRRQCLMGIFLAHLTSGIMLRSARLTELLGAVVLALDAVSTIVPLLTSRVVRKYARARLTGRPTRYRMNVNWKDALRGGPWLIVAHKESLPRTMDTVQLRREEQPPTTLEQRRRLPSSSELLTDLTTKGVASSLDA